MKNNNRKRLNLYTQVQRFAARVLLIVWLCVSCSLECVLATQGVRGLFETAVVGILALSGLKGVNSFKISEGTLAGGQAEEIPLRRLVQTSEFSDHCEDSLEDYDQDLYRNILNEIFAAKDCIDLNLSYYGIPAAQDLNTAYNLQHLLHNCRLDDALLILLNHNDKNFTDIISVSGDFVTVTPFANLTKCDSKNSHERKDTDDITAAMLLTQVT